MGPPLPIKRSGFSLFGCEVQRWLELTLDSIKWRSSVLAVLNLAVLYQCWVIRLRRRDANQHQKQRRTVI